MRRCCCGWVLLLVLAAAAAVAAAPRVTGSRMDFVERTEDYHYYCTGRCHHEVKTQTEGGFVLMGGGTDVDAAFIWMAEKTNHGDFLVIRTDLDDLYDAYIYGLGGGGLLNSAATLVIFNRSGSFVPAVARYVRRAEAIFFAGGDQYSYYHNWAFSPVSEAIMERSRAPVPIGGTSAGLASLGQFVYTAERGSANSRGALHDPYHPDITLVDDFFAFPLLRGFITDTHFYQRNRMGRLVTFCARLLADGNASSVRAIAVDEQTALLVELNGTASVVSWRDWGGAHLLYMDEPPSRCVPHQPLTFYGISVHRVGGNTSNIGNILDWTFSEGVLQYELVAVSGKLKSSNGHIYGSGPNVYTSSTTSTGYHSSSAANAITTGPPGPTATTSSTSSTATLTTTGPGWSSSSGGGTTAAAGSMWTDRQGFVHGGRRAR